MLFLNTSLLHLVPLVGVSNQHDIWEPGFEFSSLTFPTVFLSGVLDDEAHDKDQSIWKSSR